VFFGVFVMYARPNLLFSIILVLFYTTRIVHNVNSNKKSLSLCELVLVSTDSPCLHLNLPLVNRGPARKRFSSSNAQPEVFRMCSKCPDVPSRLSLSRLSNLDLEDHLRCLSTPSRFNKWGQRDHKHCLSSGAQLEK
jgi:hypothetical protein